MASTPKLLQPIMVGRYSLQNRVVLAPVTRYRANDKSHAPVVELVKEYYAQRAHTPGTLLITEATLIAPQAGGMYNVPGIWNQEQIQAWKKITDAVHEKGSFIFMQLWALGRAADPVILKQDESSWPYVSASDIAMPGRAIAPRALTIDEIREYTQLYAQAAKNAVEAGFDGVEIHGANGYLPDQFIHAISNNRTDAYGGNIVNQIRFPLEVLGAVAAAIGANRTGYRISPWAEIQGMDNSDARPTFAALAREMRTRHPDLAYLHVVEPRIAWSATKGVSDMDSGDVNLEEENDFIRDIVKPIPVISAGGYDAESALKAAEDKGDLVAFGRWFISNPDIVYRISNGLPFSKYNRSTFYTAESPVGYIDYPFYGEGSDVSANTEL